MQTVFKLPYIFLKVIASCFVSIQRSRINCVHTCRVQQAYSEVHVPGTSYIDYIVINVIQVKKRFMTMV